MRFIPERGAGPRRAEFLHIVSGPGVVSAHFNFHASPKKSTPMTILIQPLVVDSPPSDDSSPNASTIAPATDKPMTQPERKLTLLLVALAVKSIKITAMIGTGLIATPTALPRMSPMAMKAMLST